MNNRIICLLILSLLSLGCTREDPHPELLDPIYTDLINELRGAEHGYEEIIKKIDIAKEELKKTEPRTIERKNASRELQRLEISSKRAEELVEYMKIHCERRKVEGTASYKRAFAKGKSWPDKSEYERYKTNKRLSHSSRNWNDRVPRTNNNTLSSSEAETKEKPNNEAGAKKE